MPKRVFIIAEVGINHNGLLSIAEELIDKAAEAGVDAVKFQTFKTEELVSKNTPKATYQRLSIDDTMMQFEMLKKVELDEDAHKRLIKHCRRKGVIFISSPFDLGSIDLLNQLGLEIFKLPSGELTNLPYLRKVGSLNKKIIMSTGMGNLIEIKRALGILVSSGTKKKNITILHCNTEYPAPMEDVNLKAMLTIRDKLGVHVGYSDHTLGIEVPIAAVALGASVIEKHFTLDTKMPGPDHKASLDPDNLKAMVSAIRKIEQAIGNGFKKASKSERKNMEIVRKSIVASRDIRKGERFTQDNITTKRPGTGISPMRWDKIIGSLAQRHFRKDGLIEL